MMWHANMNYRTDNTEFMKGLDAVKRSEQMVDYWYSHIDELNRLTKNDRRVLADHLCRRVTCFNGVDPTYMMEWFSDCIVYRKKMLSL